jgi:hypothetical protein
MQYFIHRNNEQLGPFTEADVRAKLASGELAPSDHVWWQGQTGWVPLSQTPLAGAAVPPAAPVVAPIAPAAMAPTGATSQLAIWALVCGCLGFLCSLFTSIPAIVLGHLALGAIKKQPGLQGKGMAIAGLILGYFITVAVIIYLIVFLLLLAPTFKSQLSEINKIQSSNGMLAVPDNLTNSSDQNSSTNSPDQSTNSAPAATPSDSSTNAPTTNAAPASQ